ncbi:MAG: serine hydrolase [Clostridia bacterium]|nr:serine hydrolase [Clostridia bacterium]
MFHVRELEALTTIREQMARIPGHLGFYYQNLTTGCTFGVHEEEVFGAASVIKLPLFLHVLAESAAGRMSMDEHLTITAADKVPICGALTLFTGDVEADVRTLCRLMISISDNTATNRLIQHATIEGAQAGFRSMGLEKTQLTRKLFDRSASLKGLQNVICPREIGELLAKLYRNEFVSEAVCKEAIDTLLLQQVDHKLNGRICGEVAIAHKTGEDDQLSNDVGIVYAPQPFVICFAGHDTDVYAWEDLMRQGTWALYQAQLEST